MKKTERDVDEKHRESHGDEGRKNEMNVEGKGDREGSDVSHPRGARFARKEREGIGGENERKSLTGYEGR